jgi:FkbM family methyltransferase
MICGYRAIGARELMNLPWYHGFTLSLDVASDLGASAFVGGTCEPNEMRFIAALLRAGMTAVDVGANVGWFTLLMAGCVGPAGQVVAFEPSPRERAVLVANRQRNGLTWVTIREEALFDTHSTVTLHVADAVHAGQNTIGGFIYEGVHEVETLPVDTAPLDSLVGDLGLERIDLIKIDVEGAEYRVLRGALGSLRDYRPVLLLEVQAASLREIGDDIGSLLALLEGVDYAVCPFDDATGMPSLDRSLPLSSNIVAVPRETIASLTELDVISSQ